MDKNERKEFVKGEAFREKIWHIPRLILTAIVFQDIRLNGSGYHDEILEKLMSELNFIGGNLPPEINFTRSRKGH